MFTESLSQVSVIAITAASVFTFSVVLGVSVGVLCVLGCQRCKRSGRSSLTETEMKMHTDIVYEDPDSFLSTQSNASYGRTPSARVLGIHPLLSY